MYTESSIHIFIQTQQRQQLLLEGRERCEMAYQLAWQMHYGQYEIVKRLQRPFGNRASCRPRRVPRIQTRHPQRARANPPPDERGIEHLTTERRPQQCQEYLHATVDLALDAARHYP